VDEDDELPDRFFRERRLVLGVSVILLAHQLLGISIGKSADTLGLHFDIEDPSKLWLALWAMWTWAIVCYAQQLNSLKPWSKYPQERDGEMRSWLSDHVVFLSVRRRALRHLRDSIPQELNPRFEVMLDGRREVNTPGQQRFLYATVRVTAQCSSDGHDLLEAKAKAFDAEMEAAGWRVPGGGISREEGLSEFHREVNVRIVPIEGKLGIRVAARIWTMLSTPFLTDYFAPLVVGMTPLIVEVIGLAVTSAHRS
jgi:hypothetical protein